MNPAGGLRYAGLRSQYIYLAGLLKKIGVHADFIRIGPHRARPSSSPTSTRGGRQRRPRGSAARVRGGLQQGRRGGPPLRPTSASAARRRTVRFTASEAHDAGFVDGYAFDDELERATSELVGHPVSYQKYEDETEAPVAFGARSKVAVVLVDGDMVDTGRSSHIPLLDMSLVGSYLDGRHDPPGEGRPHDQERRPPDREPWRLVDGRGCDVAGDRELAKQKKVIVSMGSVAASGGYYIAAPAQTIYALPLTVTGSIGIFYGKADISGLLKKIGVTIDTYKTAPRADAESIFRPFSDDEIKALEVKVHQFYDVFLDRVSRGRHMTKEQVNLVARGARVDRAGGARARPRRQDGRPTARRWTRRAWRSAGLPDDAPVIELPAVEHEPVSRWRSTLVGVHVPAGA